MQSTSVLRFVIQNKLTIVIQRNLRSRIFIHANLSLLVANLVRHVVTDHFLGFVITVLS